MSFSATIRSAVILVFLGAATVPGSARSQDGPLRLKITEGVIEPVPIAVPLFVAENVRSRRLAEDITSVVATDLVGTGIFREVVREAHIADITNFESTVQFSDWKVINAEALIVGSVRTGLDGGTVVKFRLFDVFAEAQLGDGLQFSGEDGNWRRIAHKISDAIYSRITGESGYFDTQIAFISESGPKSDRIKQLAIMDYDGADVRYLTDGSSIVLAPRFSPDGSQLIYTSYETGVPRVYRMNLRSRDQRIVFESGYMAFAPRFSPDGSRVLLSLVRRGNTDIFEIELNNGRARRLTASTAIDTAPSYSPDGEWIVFESDRSQKQQLYVMKTDGSTTPKRISFGTGRYGTPVWSPRGDYIAFTKQGTGRFHIGVMQIDGSEERLLTASFLDEGPTWSTNGRVLIFFRASPGDAGGPALYSVDLTGQNLRRVPTPKFASDPNWSPLRQ